MYVRIEVCDHYKMVIFREESLKYHSELLVVTNELASLSSHLLYGKPTKDNDLFM